MSNAQTTIFNILDKKVLDNVTLLESGILLTMAAGVWIAVMGTSYAVSFIIAG